MLHVFSVHISVVSVGEESMNLEKIRKLQQNEAQVRTGGKVRLITVEVGFHLISRVRYFRFDNI